MAWVVVRDQDIGWVVSMGQGSGLGSGQWLRSPLAPARCLTHL